MATAFRLVGTQVRIAGVDAIRRALDALPPRLARKVIRKGLREGAKVVQAAAKADAPVDTGLLERAIKVRAGKRTRKNAITIGVIIGEGDFKGETFYGAFQEFGHKTGKRGSADRREVPGKRFMTRALDEKARDAAAKAESIILAGIEREADGLAGGRR